MQQFLNFLKSSKEYLVSNIDSLGHKIHIIIGNESCDLDSTISALLLGYFRSENQQDCVVIPVLNVSREHFLLRTENCFVLRNAHVPLDDLVYRDEVDLTKLTSHHELNVSLVDHHVLSNNDELLRPYVTEIFDHRPVDTSYFWDNTKVQTYIKPIGSCCTLIAEQIFKDNYTFLTKELAYLLYQTIVYDTIALKPENQKATDLDITLACKLEQTFNFNEDRQILFDRLWSAHNDISSLTPYQLLYKDLKVVEGIYIPGLPILVEEYFKLKSHPLKAVEKFAKQHEASCVLLIGLDASDGTVRRDMGIYSGSADAKLKKYLLEYLMNSGEQLNFQLEKRPTEFDEKVHLLHVNNIKVSRKVLVPIVKEAWNNFKAQQ